MSDIVSNPLLALVKERNLIDDLQLEEILQEQARSGKGECPSSGFHFAAVAR